MNLELKPRLPEDLPFVASVFAQVRTPEFAPLGLPESALHQLLQMQFQAQCSGYATQFPEAQDYIVLFESEPVGRLMVNRTGDEILLLDVALLESHRNRGIGTELIRRLCDESAASGHPLRLSVRVGSPAERLYQRAGFVRITGDGFNTFMEHRSPQPATPAAPGFPTPPEPFGSVEPGLTARYFRTLIGHTLTFRGLDGTTVDLLLQSVSPLAPPLQGPPVEPGDSFVLDFTGPLSPLLSPTLSTYTPPESQPMLLTVSALGPVNGLMTYESVFNRMTLKSS